MINITVGVIRRTTEFKEDEDEWTWTWLLHSTLNLQNFVAALTLIAESRSVLQQHLLFAKRRLKLLSLGALSYYWTITAYLCMYRLALSGIPLPGTFLRPAAKCKSAAISKPANLSCYEFWWIQTGIWLHNLMITWPYQSQIPSLNQHAGPQLHESLLQWNIQKCKLTQMHLPSLVVIPFPAKFQPRWPWNHTWRSFLGFGPGSGHLGEAWGLI